MKDKVDKEQVAKNVNKIRQTKTGDVLEQRREVATRCT